MQVGLDTAVPDWIGHLRLEAPADKIREAVMLCTKMADEAIPVMYVFEHTSVKSAGTATRVSSMLQSRHSVKYTF